MTTAHWGEMPVVAETDCGIAAVEREQMTKRRAIEVEGPTLHQPSSTPAPPNSQLYPAEHFAMDSLTLHTIKLIQHARRLRSLIHDVQPQIDSLKSVSADVPNFPLPPPLPEFQGNPPTHHPQKPVTFLPRDPENTFARGFGQSPPEIDSKICRKFLRRSVAAICAHAGYDNCAESVLETLTDLCSEYMTQMTKLMRHSVDREAQYGTTGFQDVMEQVFHEMGIGSPRVLHEFYQQKVVQYQQNMLATCQQLAQEYERMRTPAGRAAELSRAMAREREGEIPEIHFPTADDADETGETEPGLQLEGLGVDMSFGQDTGDEDNKASSTEKTGNLETYDLDYVGGSGTPSGVCSEGGDRDSLNDPGSVPAQDIMSPPSIGSRTSKPPAKKLKKK